MNHRGRTSKCTGDVWIVEIAAAPLAATDQVDCLLDSGQHLLYSALRCMPDWHLIHSWLEVTTRAAAAGASLMGVDGDSFRVRRASRSHQMVTVPDHEHAR